MFYQKDRIIIYNEPYRETKSDVIILDAPEYWDITGFEGKLIVFAGNLCEDYQRQVGGDIHRWWPIVGNEILTDYLLLKGMVWSNPYPVYFLPVLEERYSLWERPVGLLMSLLEETEGDVLDPFMGSGASAVACSALGRTFTGYEINKDLCQITVGRL